MGSGELLARHVIGENVRAMREAAGARQDDIAREARDRGLMWSRSKVAALERGDKAVSLEELVLLASAMHRVLGQPVQLADFFNGTGQIKLSEMLTVERDAFRRFFSGSDVVFLTRDIPELRNRVSGAMQQFGGRLKRTVHLMGDVANQYTPDAWDSVIFARSEAITRAAKSLGIETWELGAISAGLWGRTLMEERDHRAAVMLGEETSQEGRLSAIRGRVTRDLMTEAKTYLATREEAEPEPEPVMLTRTEPDGATVHYFPEWERHHGKPEA